MLKALNSGMGRVGAAEEEGVVSLGGGRGGEC